MGGACCRRNGHACCKRSLQPKTGVVLGPQRSCGERCGTLGFSLRIPPTHPTLSRAKLPEGDGFQALTPSANNKFSDPIRARVLDERPPPVA
jgi:hypothetical protein